MAKFLRSAGLAVPDQVGVGFEDGKHFLRVGNLLPFQHAAAGLIEDAFSQLAIVRNLLLKFPQQCLLQHLSDVCIFGLLQYGVRALHHLFSDLDQLTIFSGESSLPLRTGHALNLLITTLGGAAAIVKCRNAVWDNFTQTLYQASDHAHRIPKQAAVGGMMNLCLYDRPS